MALPFSERNRMAQIAWDEYCTVAKLPHQPMPTLFAAGFHLGAKLSNYHVAIVEEQA